VTVDSMVERKFNPLQKRDGEGQWTEDGLGLLGRIDLGSREKLISSSRISDDANGSDIDMNFAVVEGPGENEVRIGLIPIHDSDKWRAGDKGGTAVLNSEQVQRLRTGLADAAKQGKRAAADANKAWDLGHAPTDPVLRGEKPVTSGTLANDWADLTWQVHVNDGDGETNSWELHISAGDNEAGILLDPKTTGKLLRHLDGIEGQLTEDATRARSPESQPGRPAGPPQGGQFAVGGGRVGAKGKSSRPRRRGGSNRTAKKPAAPADPNLHFDGKTGTGYGIQGGDPRVRSLQQALNRLGLLDSSGNELAVDGRYGPRTTSAVKRLQKALGLPADGKVTPELLKQATALQQLPQKPPRSKPHAAPRPAPHRTRRPAPGRMSATVRSSQVLATVARALGEHRIVDGDCVSCATPTCQPAAGPHPAHTQ
jgi:hypothetical protein